MTLNELQRRRQQLFDNMVNGSATIIFSALEITRSADSTYPFRQNSDFWYLTEFNEPNAALVLLKTAEGKQDTILFNRPRDMTAEIWNGRRLGQDAAPAKLGVDKAFSYDDIADELMTLFNGLDTVYHALNEYEHADKIVLSTLDALRQGRRQNLSAPTTIRDWRPVLHHMRLFKSADEIAVMRKAGEISAKAHTRAMERCKPGMFEYHLEAEIQHEFARWGARYPAYNTIVGGGENACILHYTENESELKAGDLVLIDAGCEYLGYAGDITRTFPVSGKFTPEQRAVYDIVLASQYKALELLVPGSSIKQANEQVIRIMVEGLVKLGVMQGNVDELIEAQAYRQFYMHGLGHWLGLDVHDVGDYSTPERSRTLEPGMVLTVEPGLYIAAHPNVPKAYHNIGVRIEDNIVITETGNEVLTADVVKNADDIEAIMAKGK